MIYRRVDAEDGEDYWVEAPEVERLDLFARSNWPNYEDTCSLGWVYTLYGDNDETLYVGVSMNPASRVKAHHSKPWWHEVRRVAFQAVDGGDRWHEERARIEALQPKYNRLWTPRWNHSMRKPARPQVFPEMPPGYLGRSPRSRKYRNAA